MEEKLKRLTEIIEMDYLGNGVTKKTKKKEALNLIDEIAEEVL